MYVPPRRVWNIACAGRHNRIIRHNLLVNTAVLAHIQRRQVKAEYFRGAPEMAQISFCQQPRFMLLERPDDDVEILDEFHAFRVGWGWRDRTPLPDRMTKPLAGCSKAGINTDKRAPVGLVSAAGRRDRGDASARAASSSSTSTRRSVKLSLRPIRCTSPI